MQRSGPIPSPFGRTRLAACAAALTLGVAACGSGSGPFAAPLALSSPPGTEIPLASGQMLPAGSGFPGASSTGGGSSRTVPAPTGHDALQAFCRDAALLQSILPSLIFQAGSPQAAANANSIVSRLKSEAPVAVRPAVDTVVQTEQRIVADLTATPPRVADLSQALTNGAYLQALQQLNLFTVSNCTSG